MVQLRLALWFHPNQDGRSPYLRSSSLEVDPFSSPTHLNVDQFILLESINESFVSFNVPIDPTNANLYQKWFELPQGKGSASGVVSGSIEIQGTSLFFPNRGTAYLIGSGNFTIRVEIVGPKRRVSQVGNF